MFALLVRKSAEEEGPGGHEWGGNGHGSRSLEKCKDFTGLYILLPLLSAS